MKLSFITSRPVVVDSLFIVVPILFGCFCVWNLVEEK